MSNKQPFTNKTFKETVTFQLNMSVQQTKISKNFLRATMVTGLQAKGVPPP